MSTLTAHISRGVTRIPVVAAVATCAAATSLSLPTTASAREHSTTAAAYGWPVRPFDRQHPIRGGFGDPRTVFFGPPTTEDLMAGKGSFQFHFGVDISAADGTKVYPVVSGTVLRVCRDWISVDTGDGRIFQYWHIRPAVKIGNRVERDKTVLGTILKASGHVHLTELDNHKIANPLQPGHLMPYTDTTIPEVSRITFRSDDVGPELMPSFLRGSVEMIAEAYDTPSLPVPGSWRGMPVAPALITWRAQGLAGHVVVSERVAADFRRSVPDDSLFWSYYARGTYQNMSVFTPHYSFGQPGCFLFKLSRTPFDTRAIEDGVYDLVVTVTDIRGNHSSSTQRITIHNRSGWQGS